MIDFVIDDEGDYESSMTGSDRRQEILKNIKESDRPVSGSKLAKDYDVSRQGYCSGYCLLRASGYDIIINKPGICAGRADLRRESFKVRHTDEQLETELCNYCRSWRSSEKCYGKPIKFMGILRRNLELLPEEK